MSTLKAKAQGILDEKTAKIVAANIKDGVTIFDVTGEYSGPFNVDLSITTSASIGKTRITSTHTIINSITGVNIDTSNIDTMAGFYQGLTSVKTINADLSSATDVRGLCNNCNQLETVNITNMRNSIDSGFYMFCYCENLKRVNGLNMAGMKNISQMFYQCKNLEELDLSTINISKITSNNSFINGVPTTCHIIFNTRTDYDWFVNIASSDYYNITINDETAYNITVVNKPEEISPIPTKGYVGITYKFNLDSMFRKIKSFKLNGTTYTDTDTFVMPAQDITITDIVIEDNLVFESEHNPYYGTDWDTQIPIEGEVPGADKLKIVVDYGFRNNDYVRVWYVPADSEDDEEVSAYLNGNGVEGESTHISIELLTKYNWFYVEWFAGASQSTAIDYYGYKITTIKLDENGNEI